MTDFAIITEDDGTDARQGKLCRCYKCGIEARCTPRFDFYSKVGSADKRLYCENCMRAGHNEKVVDAEIVIGPIFGKWAAYGKMRGQE